MNKWICMLSGENIENSVIPNISDKRLASSCIGRMRPLDCQRGMVTALIGNLSSGVARTIAFRSASQASMFQYSSFA